VNNIFVSTIKFFWYRKSVTSYMKKKLFVITLKITYKIFRRPYSIAIIHTQWSHCFK